MANCDGCSCSSERILIFSAKCNDLFSAEYNGVEYSGYVPNDLGIGGGDYIKMGICLNCGKVQYIENYDDPKFYTYRKTDED